MTRMPRSRQKAMARLRLGSIFRPAGVSIGAPGAMKSFSMSTTINAVFRGSTRSTLYGIQDLLSGESGGRNLLFDEHGCFPEPNLWGEFMRPPDGCQGGA